MADIKTVAVLGTGIMGAAMARNLLKAGILVRAWNRSREKAESLAQDGAEVADAPDGAAENADFLLTMLPDADVIEEVIGDGVLPALAESGVWLQMSTVGEEGNERLARLATEGGVAYVDAPVLGTKEPAEEGQLVVLASGPEEVRERCESVFAALGSKTVWIGGAGGPAQARLEQLDRGYPRGTGRDRRVRPGDRGRPRDVPGDYRGRPSGAVLRADKGKDDARGELPYELLRPARAQGCRARPRSRRGAPPAHEGHRGRGGPLRRGGTSGSRREGHGRCLRGGEARPRLTGSGARAI